MNLRKWLNYFLMLFMLYVLEAIVTKDGDFNVLNYPKDAFFTIYIIGTLFFLSWKTDFLDISRKNKFLIKMCSEDKTINYFAIPWVLSTLYVLIYF